MNTNLPKGAQIFTSDGHELGSVKEVRGDYFKVDAPMAPDYWLSCHCIGNTGSGRVQLSFVKDNLDANKVSEPAGVS